MSQRKRYVWPSPKALGYLESYHLPSFLTLGQRAPCCLYLGAVGHWDFAPGFIVLGQLRIASFRDGMENTEKT